MFRRLFGGQPGGSNQPAGGNSHQEGRLLFEQGMAAANDYRTADAIALYTKSFAAHANPSPLINRAKLYSLRLLFADAIQDLENAKRLDERQGNEFGFVISAELRKLKLLSQNRFNGKRELLIADLKAKGFDHVAGRIADTIFEGDGQMLGYHLVDEVDNVKKFENMADFPAVKTLTTNWIKDQAAIDSTLGDERLSDRYRPKREIFQAMICVYDYRDMAKLRDVIIRKIWCLLNPPSQMQAIWEVSMRRPIE